VTSRNFTTEDAEDFFRSINQGINGLPLQYDAYGHSYRALLKLAEQSLDDENHDAAHSLACAVYGWMPTILKTFEINLTKLEKPISQIKIVNSLEDASKFIRGIGEVAPINRSWVGTSKFLHFLNPTVFPIWDSRVAISFHRRIANFARTGVDQERKAKLPTLNHFSNKRDNYLEYMRFMSASAKVLPGWIEEMQEKVYKECGYTPTALRCMELVLFNRYAHNTVLQEDGFADSAE
jgi:hypothetical protein